MAQETTDKVTIYTDGSSRGNPGPGGYGIVLISGSHRKELAQGFKHTTNNRMELLGVIEALKALKRRCKVDLYSDSQYVVHAIEKKWLEGWKRKNWRTSNKEKVKNVDLWLKLDELLNVQEVTFHWVRGHNGHPENERCDVLAVAAASKGPLLDDTGFGDDNDSSPPNLLC
jgi:ribonuclease HI